MVHDNQIVIPVRNFNYLKIFFNRVKYKDTLAWITLFLC